MKKLLLAFAAAVLLAGCGVGSYTVVSGRADEGFISFVTDKSMPVRVIIGDKEYNINSVKHKAYRKDRKIKQTSKNTVRVAPGTQEVLVLHGKDTLYSKKLFVSASEHRIIEL